MTQTYSHLIATALASSDWVEGERLCEIALSSSPDDPTILVSMALVMRGQDRLAEATEILARLASLHLDDALHWKNYAVILLQAGQMDDAEQALQKLASLEPDNVVTLLELGLLQMRRHHYVSARSTFLAALAIDRNSPIARIHAARACTYCRDYEDAELLLQPWAEWLPLDDESQLELGSLLLAQSKGDAARVVVEAVASRSPSNIQALLILGTVCERLNRIAEAQSCCDQLGDRINPLDEGPYRELLTLKAKLAFRRRDFDAAQNFLEVAGPMAVNDFAHYFSLAGIYDKQGESTLALQALRTAHDLQMNDLLAVLPDGSSLEDGIFATGKILLGKEEYRKWPSTLAPEPSHSPIFIVGFPRSGTTLLEQMLDAHPGLQSMDEKPFVSQLGELLQANGLILPRDLWKLEQADCDELRKRYLTMVCGSIPRKWDAQLIDKNPLNMLLLPLIYRLFPKAKFVFALRHPFDVILSCYQQNFRSSALASACESLQKLAITYVSATESWLHHESVLKPDVMTLRYENLVENMPQEAVRMADFLDLSDASPFVSFKQHARNKGFIGTPSYTQVVEPINRLSVNRWMAYQREFEPLLPILEPVIKRLGYSVT